MPFCVRRVGSDVGVMSCHSVAGHWSRCISTYEYGARNDGELSVIFLSPAGISAAYRAWRSIFGAVAKGRLRS
jgi:hypothetical protein